MIGLIFILGLAFADKLDRTYLPPPGSKFSGGVPGSIQVPFEHSRFQYPSTVDENFKPTQITIGIDRVGGKKIGEKSQDIYSPLNNSLTYPENTFIVPTAYAFPQTAVSSKDGYLTANLIDYPSNYSHNKQNSYQSIDQHPKRNQAKLRPGYFNSQLESTENYSQLNQDNIPIPGVSQSDHLPNQDKSHNEYEGSTIDPISKSNPSSLPVFNDLTNDQYESDQYLSPISANQPTNSLSPSKVNYTADFSTSLEPKKFYSTTTPSLQFSTTGPKSSINNKHPTLHHAYIKNRPERIQAQADREASILSYKNSITPEGYAYSYDTSNGIHADEIGVTVNGNKAKGSYSYVGDDGKLYSVLYTADENGFRPQGDHLPTSPPIPDAILKVIEQVTKEKEAGIIDDGSYNENKYGYRQYYNGFYDPKSGDHSKVYNNKLKNKNTNNVTPNYNKSLKNIIGDGSDKEATGYENYDTNKITTPINNEYLKNDDFENFGSRFPSQPHQIHNNSEIKPTGPYDENDHQTGDETNSRLPSDLLESAYKNVVNNEKKKINKEPTINKIGNNYDFTEGIHKENRPNEYNSEESYTETGYEYNRPQHTQLNKIPLRFSDIQNKQIETQKQRNYNKVTPKPFQTPYVTRKNEENLNYNILVKPFENERDKSDDEEFSQKNYSDESIYPIHSEDDINARYGYNRTDDIGDPHTTDDGYSPQQGILDSEQKSYDAFLPADPNFYTSSTIKPTEFTHRISTIKTQDPKNSAGKPQTSLRQESIIHSITPVPSLYQIKKQLNQTSNLPLGYSTLRPGLIDQYAGDGVSNEASTVGYPETENELDKTTPGLEFSTHIPRIGISYAPYTDIANADEYGDGSTTENIIGEDFSGPKQPQSFDPLNGYYY